MENKVGYNSSFAEEVFRNVDSGDEIKMCMNCGVCAASCPLREHMDYPPRQIFSLIRAGKREEVLGSQSIMLCTSCYTCAVKCPRSIPVIDVMHGLAHYALSKGYTPRVETARFGKEFWNQVYRLGRVDEKDLPRRVFFAGGFWEGVKKVLNFMDIGIKLMLHHRMKLLPERKIKEINSLKKMLDKAELLGKGGAVQ
jgi:quinone-modifying oxidoreductase, subunit QmoC